MEKTYHQLTISERCEIARLCAAGCSIRKIASALDRQPSTIVREIARNKGTQERYSPEYANQQSRARRWRGSMLDRNPTLQKTVLSLLGIGWSPTQVAKRLARDRGKPVISYETIYRFIYAQIARTKNHWWRLYLPRGKSKRGLRGRKGGEFSLIHCQPSLNQRTAERSQ